MLTNLIVGIICNIHLYQIITLYTLSLYTIIHQLHLNKLGKPAPPASWGFPAGTIQRGRRHQRWAWEWGPLSGWCPHKQFRWRKRGRNLTGMGSGANGREEIGDTGGVWLQKKGELGRVGQAEGIAHAKGRRSGWLSAAEAQRKGKGLCCAGSTGESRGSEPGQQGTNQWWRLQRAGKVLHSKCKGKF